MSESYDGIAQQLSLQLSERLPGILNQLLQTGFNPADEELELQCSLTATGRPRNEGSHVQVASVNLSGDLTPLTRSTTPRNGQLADAGALNGLPHLERASASAVLQRLDRRNRPARRNPLSNTNAKDRRPNKRRKSVAGPEVPDNTLVRSDNQAPSSLQKLIDGIWASIYKDDRMDPAEIIEQWQAIEASGQPKLLTDNNQDVTTRRKLGAFGRMNILTRKISQTTRTARSLEVVVQAHWIQCFDDRVAELSESLTREAAKKSAIAEACADFKWSEKELRNKMAIWKGYSDIKNAAGWVALAFAGQGLYRYVR